MLYLRQPLILPFLYHKSATNGQIYLIKVSNAKLKPDLCSCMKTKTNEATALPQQPCKRDTIFLYTLQNFSD